MKRLSIFLGIISLSGLVLPAATGAQLTTVPASKGTRIHYSSLYDPGTVETVQGEVLSLGKSLSGNGRDYCLNLTLNTSRGKILVILMPESYHGEKSLPIRPKDRLEVKGSRVTLPGTPAIIAAEIRKGERLLKLRDATGRPVWAVGDNWHVH